MSLETLHKIWEELVETDCWALADEVMDEILARTIARDAILDWVHGCWDTVGVK